MTATRSSAREALDAAVVGLLFGFVLSRTGFAAWDEIHAMFRLQDPRLLLVFGLALTLLSVAWALIRRVSSPRWSSRPMHKGSILGGALFGVGWALSGACPSIALVQLGEGQLAALVTIGGVVVGNWLYGIAQHRWLHWSATSCVDD